MNFSWFGIFVFAMIAALVSASTCPSPFKSEKGLCTAQRTIRGECPSGSTYKINVNACVFGG
ncbi:uncharacterized protein LOC6563321 [Drosophila grimshawi]|uniref:GH18175 n=1 Tax=Drosophila grimshawi TaxID=7222 RepID=B4JG55_DROGR|nr:uncharacterized protein LOC6563321 [Drosophila grimshawi]EDV93622.1 GH18175 [Drosophila grimshawi]